MNLDKFRIKMDKKRREPILRTQIYPVLGVDLFRRWKDFIYNNHLSEGKTIRVILTEFLGKVEKKKPRKTIRKPKISKRKK